MSLFEGPKDLTEVLVKTVVYILDTQETRCYLRPGVEIEVTSFRMLTTSEGVARMHRSR